MTHDVRKMYDVYASVYSYFLCCPPKPQYECRNTFPSVLWLWTKGKPRLVGRGLTLAITTRTEPVGYANISTLSSESAWHRDEGRYQEVSSSIFNRKQGYKET